MMTTQAIQLMSKLFLFLYTLMGITVHIKLTLFKVYHHHHHHCNETGYLSF
jgi:hypothetical protein